VVIRIFLYEFEGIASSVSAHEYDTPTRHTSTEGGRGVSKITKNIAPLA